MKSSVSVVILYILLHQKILFVSSNTAENVTDSNLFENCEEFCYSQNGFLKIEFNRHDKDYKNTMEFDQIDLRKNSNDVKKFKYAKRWLTYQLSHCNAMDEISNISPYNPKETYNMKLHGMKPFDGLCASGPGWIVVQRRFDGSVDFNRTWNEYKEGFGNIQGEFFIGLDRLHLKTTSAQHELCVRIADIDGDSVYAHYTHFEIGNEEEFYELKYLDGFSGTGRNYYVTSKHSKFSTIDRDNDKDSFHCAKKFNGWWFNSCQFYRYAPNGPYEEDGVDSYGSKRKLPWKRSFTYSHYFSEMMIRSKI